MTDIAPEHQEALVRAETSPADGPIRNLWGDFLAQHLPEAAGEDVGTENGVPNTLSSTTAEPETAAPS